MKTVHGEFRDEAGNVMATSDQITVDTTPPGMPVFDGEPEFTHGLTNTVQWSDSGAAAYFVPSALDLEFNSIAANTGWVTSLSHTFIELDHGQIYFYQIQAGPMRDTKRMMFVWQDFIPGENQWTGFAVSMGVDCFVVGPGELFTWDFLAQGYGLSNITAVSVLLMDAAGMEILDVELPAAEVLVVGGESAVWDDGMLMQPTIAAVPNPCNPMTNIEFWLPEPCHASLAIYDMKGRLVRNLLDGPVSGEWNSVRWDGRGQSGQIAPSGVYLYQLISKQKTLSGRVTLAR